MPKSDLYIGVLSGTSADSIDALLVDFSNSVSYTHLRAHETSLHLVCRLLLEKKEFFDHAIKMINRLDELFLKFYAEV